MILTKLETDNPIHREAPQIHWDYVTSIYVVVAQLTTTGSDEFVVDELLPMSILAVVLVCGKMLAAIVVAASIQLAYSTKYALTAYEKVTRELIDMLKNQGLSGKYKNICSIKYRFQTS